MLRLLYVGLISSEQFFSSLSSLRFALYRMKTKMNSWTMTSELRILEQGIETVIIKARDDYSLGGFVFH
jgi:hypothetical protein